MVALEELGRGLFGCCLGLSWTNSLTQAASAHRLVYERVDLRVPVSRRVVLGATAASVLFVVVLASFVRGFWVGTSGLVLVALLAAMRHVETRQWPGNLVVELGKYVPTLACLCAFLVVYAATSGMAAAQREDCGWAAACGVGAACYALAGWAKLRTPGWADAQHLQLLIAERSYRGSAWSRALRRWVAARVSLCGALGAVSLWGEIVGGILFLWPEARLWVAVAMAAMHVGIFLFLGYFEPEWILLLFALAWVTG